MNKRCLDCDQEISGRKDKKFCNDQCRINYHNTIAQEKHRAFRKINSILNKNRNILYNNCILNKTVLTRSQLQNEGFNFNFHTHIVLVDGRKITFEYDYGYESFKRPQIKIISARDL